MKRAFVVVVGKLSVMAVCVISSFVLAQTQQGWEVSGTVTNDSGPVKSAHVIISGPSSIPPAVTDAQGRYSLEGVVPGRYLIGVAKQDNINAPQPRSLTLASGLRLRVDFRMPKGAVISGRILDGDRQPVPGLIVQAMSKTIVDGRLRLNEQGGDKTNDLGEYRIPYLPEGAYVIAVMSKPLPPRKRTSGPGAEPGSGYASTTFYPGTSLLEAAAVLELRSGEERPGVDIAVQKQATRCISFKVGSAFDGPRVFAQLEERLGATAPSLAEGPVTATGSYGICGLTPGEYRLHLSSITGPRLQVLGYQMAVAFVDKQNVDLGSLEPLAQEDMRGTVTVKDGRPGDSIPAGIRVRIVAWDLRAVFTDMRPGLVQADGTFLLRQVFTGDYGVRVDGLPAGYYLIGASQQGRSVLDRGLRPGNGDVQITLGADAPAVGGRVLAADGAAIPDATVFLVPKESGRHLVAQTDQTGAYRFVSGVQPGEYRLVAASDLAGWQRQDTAAAIRLAANGMELKLGPRESRAVDLPIQATR